MADMFLTVSTGVITISMQEEKRRLVHLPAMLYVINSSFRKKYASPGEPKHAVSIPSVKKPAAVQEALVKFTAPAVSSTMDMCIKC